MKYLGIPLDSSFKAHSVWSYVLERVERRLMGGKNYICIRVIDFSS